MKSDQEVKEMNEFKAKLGTSETKLSKSSNINTKVCKDLKEDLENAEELLNQILIQGQEPLTMTMLAAAVPQDPKQMLGERLFPRIWRMYPDLFGKFTGILLEK